MNSLLRCSLASSMCCFAASLLRCLDLGCIVVASLLRHVIASLLCGSLASPLRCFAASLLVEATSESRFEYAIRNHFSKSLVSVTLSSVRFHSAPHYSVHLYARAHTSIYPVARLLSSIVRERERDSPHKLDFSLEAFGPRDGETHDF